MNCAFQQFGQARRLRMPSLARAPLHEVHLVPTRPRADSVLTIKCSRHFVAFAIAGLFGVADAAAAQTTNGGQRAAATAQLPLINEGYPRISPDGRYLLFVSDATGTYDVWLRELATGHTTPLVTSPGLDYSARWSPDGSRVVFSSDRDGDSDVWELDLRDGSQRKLVESSAAEHEPSYSADGSSIVFSRTVREGSVDLGERRVILQRTLTDSREIVLTDGVGVDSYASLSPDGTMLLYRQSLDGENSDIWVKNLRSGATRNLSRHPSQDDYPAWSPDGKHVVFASDRAAAFRSGFDLYVVAPDGTGLRRLTVLSDDARFIHRPTFSPSGASILANRRRGTRLEAVCIPFNAFGASASEVASLTVLTPDTQDASTALSARRDESHQSSECDRIRSGSVAR